MRILVCLLWLFFFPDVRMCMFVCLFSVGVSAQGYGQPHLAGAAHISLAASTMGLLSTPTSSKKRKVGGRAVETGVDRMLSSGAESDLKYVTKELEDKPEVLAEVARLLRDGELEKAIRRKQTAAVQA